MKKQLLIFAALLAFSATFAAELVAPVRTMVIPQAKGAMEINGEDTEAWWSAEQTTEAFNPTGSTGADADYTFSFKVCYDANYMYFFCKILDEYESNFEWGGSNQWTFDNIEHFMNLDTNGTVAAYDSNTIQIRWNRGLDSINDGGRAGAAVMRPATLYSWGNTADGWAFESAVPWIYVLGAGQKPEDILAYCDGEVVSGFDMSGADSDTDGADHRDCQTAWDNDEPQDAADRTEDNAWNNRNVFGTVTFEKYNAVNDFNEANSSVAYPNPTSGVMHLVGVSGAIQISNLAGQVVMETVVDNNQINISNLPAGVYTASTNQGMLRIIKQ